MKVGIGVNRSGICLGRKVFAFLGLVCLLILTVGCERQIEVISQIEEKEANVILVLLRSKGVHATKVEISSSGGGGGDGSVSKYAIMTGEDQFIEAIAYLNQNGFPRVKGATLLELFAKQGLMTSDREETIRYQSGLAQQLTNTITMIDGVIDADVQLSFPSQEGLRPGETTKERITASVYVKHQGIIDDPNIHLENKIKRLVSGSISGLDINDVTVVSDRSRFTDIRLGEMVDPDRQLQNDYVSVWSMVMSQESVGRFRVLFISLLVMAILFGLALAWLGWKFYPRLKHKEVWLELCRPYPWKKGGSEEEEQEEFPDAPNE